MNKKHLLRVDKKAVSLSRSFALPWLAIHIGVGRDYKLRTFNNNNWAELLNKLTRQTSSDGSREKNAARTY